MALKAVYETQDDIPEQYRELYTERDGKFELTGIEGIKTQEDVNRVQSALTKERNDHKETRDKLKAFENVDLEQIETDQNELVELRAKVEAGAGESFDQEKFDEAVGKVAEARVKTETAPLKRELEKVTKERDDAVTENTEHRENDRKRTIGDAVRAAAGDAKVVGTAMDDVLMLGERVFEITEGGDVVTKDGVGVTPGIAPDIWLSEMQEKRPHWWPTSQGGGAHGGTNGGGFANNPFSAEHWNLTEQGKLVTSDRNKAERMAKAAGVHIGATAPAKKPAQQQSA